MSLTACDDPIPGEIGGLVLMIRTVPTSPQSKFADVARVVITYDAVEVIHRTSLSNGSERTIRVDSHTRTIELRNQARDLLVGQYQVPIGYVTEIRIRASAARLYFRDGSDVNLPVDNPWLPSWQQSGWKISAEDGTPFPIIKDELTGVRGLMVFEDRLVRPPHEKQSGKGKGNGPTWKIKPTLPAQLFVVNPPPDEPGVFLDQITVVFHPGIPLVRILEINSAIGASVLRYPVLTTWYRMKLPASIDLRGAASFYSSKSEVRAVMPALNLATAGRLTPGDGQQPNYDISRIREAWGTAQAASGTVGNHAVRVAIIEAGSPDVTHPDLYRNIAINQAQLPVALFDTNNNRSIEPAEIAARDFDPPGNPDGIISIRDLEDPRNAAIAPPDSNGNKRIDAADLLADPRWGPYYGGGKGDLVGWNFDPGPLGNSRDLGPVDKHFTMVAGLIGAEGGNTDSSGKALGIAGVNWRVSIIPVAASISRKGTVLHEAFGDALAYVEELGVDVVNISQTYYYTSEDLDYRCGFKTENTFAGIPWGDLSNGMSQVRQEYDFLFRTYHTGKPLYVVAAGNNSYFLDDPHVDALPAEAMREVLPGRVLVVGNAATAWEKAPHSSYGPETVEIYAPGENWTSLVPGGGVDTLSGTSFAAAIVAGSAALLAAVKPSYRENGVALREAILGRAARVLSACCNGTCFAYQRLLDAEYLLAGP